MFTLLYIPKLPFLIALAGIKMTQTMDVACSTNANISEETVPNFNQNVVDCILDGFRENNDITVETIKYRVLRDVMHQWELSFQHISQLFKTHTPVDEGIRLQFLSCLPAPIDMRHTLSQDFVRNKKLLKILKTLRKGGHETLVYSSLAMDGLAGNKPYPNYGMGSYLDRLSIDLEGTGSMYDRAPDESFKLRHVLAVRKVYDMLQLMGKNESLYKHVYTVIRKVLKEMKPDLELPEEGQMDEQDLNRCIQEYKSIMSEEQLKKYMLDVHGIHLHPTTVETMEECVNAESETKEMKERPQKKQKTTKGV